MIHFRDADYKYALSLRKQIPPDISSKNTNQSLWARIANPRYRCGDRSARSGSGPVKDILCVHEHDARTSVGDARAKREWKDFIL